MKSIGYSEIVDLIIKHKINKEHVSPERLASALMFILKNNNTIDSDTEED